MREIQDMHAPKDRLVWLGPVRMLVILIMAFGYASTMPRGPGTAEYLNVFGYDPSWFAIQTLFMMSGYLAIKSLYRHGSALKLLSSRAARNLPSLAVFALLVVFIIYPVFGAPAPEEGRHISQHLDYFFKVISCVDPDAQTPGLLDNALYKCAIQGGLWTFRWGMIAFIGTALAWTTGILKQKVGIVILTLLALFGHALTVIYAVRHPELNGTTYFDLLNVGLRLGWVYFAGMSLYVWRHTLPRSFFFPVVCLGLAALQFILLPWTVFIEITAICGFGSLVWLAMTSSRPAPQWISKLPDLSLGIFIYCWPVAQILLLLMPKISAPALILLSLPLTIAIAGLNWWGLQKLVPKPKQLANGLMA